MAHQCTSFVILPPHRLRYVPLFSSVRLLEKTYFGGGAAGAYSATSTFMSPRTQPHQWFEDGTVSFIDIMALKHGFDALTRVGGMRIIRTHTHALTA